MPTEKVISLQGDSVVTERQDGLAEYQLVRAPNGVLRAVDRPKDEEPDQTAAPFPVPTDPKALGIDQA